MKKSKALLVVVGALVSALVLVLGGQVSAQSAPSNLAELIEAAPDGGTLTLSG